jgi:hypothetical protein
VSTPEDAIARARAEAEAMRARGAYADAGDPAPEPPPLVTSAQLIEWAVIEPDVAKLRSTRSLGAPITAVKQGLLRLLAQYHAELTAQQTRFNVNLLARVRRLEERVAELERERDGERKPTDPPR